MAEDKQVLLKVEHLEQYFKMGNKQLKAVDDVNFEIYKGEVFGLVGESGCGKTTTGRSIIRLYDITGGSVYFEGQRICAGVRPYVDEIKRAKKAYRKEVSAIRAKEKAEIAEGADKQTVKEKYAPDYQKQSDILLKIVEEQTAQIKSAKFDHKNCNKVYARQQQKLVDDKYLPLINSTLDEQEKKAITKKYKAERKLAGTDRITNKIQMIFQDPIASLNPRMTVREIIAEGLIIRGVKDKDYINEQVYRVLEMVGLVREHADRYPHEFSGGQRQRIGIARSIILNPSLIIADEPISALDVSIQAQVINILNELRNELGLTVLFIAHDLSVVKYFSDRIAVMYFGKIVELATSDELFAHPLHPYTKSLLSAIPVPDPHYERQRKRIVYNPLADHDYSQQQPTLREVAPGHFVSCNDAEEQKYKQEIAEKDKASVATAEQETTADTKTKSKTTTKSASKTTTRKSSTASKSTTRKSTATKTTTKKTATTKTATKSGSTRTTTRKKSSQSSDKTDTTNN